MFGISFIAPILQLLVLGYAASLDVSDMPTVVCDMDHSAASRELVDHFTATGYFSVKGYAECHADVDHWLDDGHASIALVIPKNFERNLDDGKQAPLQLIADGTETSSASIGFSYASMIVAQYSQNILLESLLKRGQQVTPAQVSPEVRVWYRSRIKKPQFYGTRRARFAVDGDDDDSHFACDC